MPPPGGAANPAYDPQKFGEAQDLQRCAQQFNEKLQQFKDLIQTAPALGHVGALWGCAPHAHEHMAVFHL